MLCSSLKVVIETNVWISGLLTRTGTAALLTRHVVQNGQAVFTAQTFAELKDRMWRPKFDRYVTLEQRKKLLSCQVPLVHKLALQKVLVFCIASLSKPEWVICGSVHAVQCGGCRFSDNSPMLIRARVPWQTWFD